MNNLKLDREKMLKSAQSTPKRDNNSLMPLSTLSNFTSFSPQNYLKDKLQVDKPTLEPQRFSPESIRKSMPRSRAEALKSLRRTYQAASVPQK
jgi:hypothetical protein